LTATAREIWDSFVEDHQVDDITALVVFLP